MVEAHHCVLGEFTMLQRLLLPTLLAALLPLGLTPTSIASASGADDLPDARSVRTTASGMVIQQVQEGDVTVTTYGPDAPRVLVESDSSADVSDAPGEVSVSVAVNDDADTNRAADVGPTVYEMTLASGHFTPEEACEFARGMDGFGCRTSAEVMRERAAAPARSAVAATAVSQP